MKYIASCSFGKDSLAMILRIIKEQLPLDEVIFFDTGMEFDSIYKNRDKIRTILENKNIKYTELRSSNHFLFDMLVRPVKYRKKSIYPYHYGYGWCGANGIRWGTANKLSVIKRYYKRNYQSEEIFEYVGIAADEMERAKQDCHKIYPLINWGMKECDCLQYCYDNGFNWNENGVELYEVLDRVSCWCCQNKNLKELKNMYMYLPQYWQKLRGLQSRIPEPMKGKGKSVFDLEDRFREEIDGCIHQ